MYMKSANEITRTMYFEKMFCNAHFGWIIPLKRAKLSAFRPV